MQIHTPVNKAVKVNDHDKLVIYITDLTMSFTHAHNSVKVYR